MRGIVGRSPLPNCFGNNYVGEDGTTKLVGSKWLDDYFEGMSLQKMATNNEAPKRGARDQI
jgi:hypothetical protein